MANKQKRAQSAISEMIQGADFSLEKKPEPKTEEPQDLVTPKGIGLKASEWERMSEIAEELGVKTHALAMWALRDFMKRYDAGEVETRTTRQKTLPGL